jgi:hypothetical protein
MVKTHEAGKGLADATAIVKVEIRDRAVITCGAK